MASQFPRVELSATALRARYASSDYPQRIAAGELERVVVFDRPIPGGGTSRIIAYRERNQSVKVVVVHQRTHRDGTATTPDPKLVFLDGTFYWAR